MVRRGRRIQESPNALAIHEWKMFQKAAHFFGLFIHDLENKVMGGDAAASAGFKELQTAASNHKAPESRL